jgi:hypothetical protein
MSVLITRLITGEEILGSITESSDDTCTIDNPVHIAASQNPSTGKIDIHMAPFVPLCVDKLLTINLKNVLCQYEPVLEIKNKYSTMFGSGIIIPSNTGIAGV